MISQGRMFHQALFGELVLKWGNKVYPTVIVKVLCMYEEMQW